jgi:hypothetical protein
MFAAPVLVALLAATAPAPPPAITFTTVSDFVRDCSPKPAPPACLGFVFGAVEAYTFAGDCPGAAPFFQIPDGVSADQATLDAVISYCGSRPVLGKASAVTCPLLAFRSLFPPGGKP